MTNALVNINILHSILIEDVTDPKTGKVIAYRETKITPELITIFMQAGIYFVHIRR